jgi:hypothetical protein
MPVVNKAIDFCPSIGGSDGFRGGVLYHAMGPSYIDLAIKTARAADPQARLDYNDNRYELAGEETPFPLIKPEVRFPASGFSDWLHRKAHGIAPNWTRRR